MGVGSSASALLGVVVSGVVVLLLLVVVCLLVGCLMSQQHASVSQGMYLLRQLYVLPH